MGAVWARVRSESRRRWRSWLGLAVLVGVVGGLVTGIAAGARRTETAYDRLQQQSRAADLLVLDTSLLNPEARVDLDMAAQLPGVADAVLVHGLLTLGVRADGQTLGAQAVAPFSVSGDGLGRRLERKHLLAGRFADPEAIDEMVVSYEAARRYDVGPGSTLELTVVEQSGLAAAGTELIVGLTDRVAGRDLRRIDTAAAAGARTYRFDVVGVSTSPMDFPPVPGTLQPIVYLTPAFHEATGRNLVASPILVVRLERGVEVADYKAAIEQRSEGRTVTYSGGASDRAVTVKRAVDLQAKALWFLAAFVALAALIVVVQVLSRQVALEADDHTTLRALGMTRAGLLASGTLRAGAMAVVAGAVVVLTAWTLSPLFPRGSTAAAEPSPGVQADPTALAIGAVIVMALTFLVSVVALQRLLTRETAHRDQNSSRRRRRSDDLLRRAPVSVRLGVSLALDPGLGRSAMPVRSAVAAVSVAVGAAAMALTVTASLAHLTETPRLYGWVWDAQIGGVGTPDLSVAMTAGLRDNRAVESFAVGTIVQLQVDGTSVDGYAVDNVEGEIEGALIEGRAPTRPDEIVLGTATLDDVGASIGDRVVVSVGDRTAAMRVVGRSVFPNVGDAGQLGRGARLTFTGLERVAPNSLRTVILVDFEDESARPEGLAQLRRALDVLPVHDDLRPTDLLNFGEPGTFSVVITLTVALVAAATLVHTLVTSIRRRRRDLALLKTLGFSRRQLSSTVASQATVISAAAVLIGIPLGVAAGRTARAVVAGASGFPSEPVVPAAELAALAVGVVVVANLVALGPGWTVRRTPAARVLRTE